MTRTAIVTMALAVVAAAGAPAAQQDPAVTELLRIGNEYLGSYVQRASGAALDERYTLVEVSGGSMSVPLRITSEVVLVNVNGRLYGFRDAAAVDGARIRDPKVSRLMPLLTEPTQASWTQAQKISNDSFRYFASELIVLLHDPMLALHFIQPASHAKFTYRIDGKKKMNNVQVTALRFEETQGELTKYVMGTRGNGWSSGRVWMEPATGTVHQTEFWLDSTTEGVRVSITYALNAPSTLWLPSKMAADYDMRPAPENVINRGVGGYGARMKYQANAEYSNARYTPVDLTKMR